MADKEGVLSIHSSRDVSTIDERVSPAALVASMAAAALRRLRPNLPVRVKVYVGGGAARGNPAGGPSPSQEVLMRSFLGGVCLLGVVVVSGLAYGPGLEFWGSESAQDSMVEGGGVVVDPMRGPNDLAAGPLFAPGGSESGAVNLGLSLDSPGGLKAVQVAAGPLLNPGGLKASSGRASLWFAPLSSAAQMVTGRASDLKTLAPMRAGVCLLGNSQLAQGPVAAEPIFNPADFEVGHGPLISPGGLRRS